MAMTVTPHDDTEFEASGRRRKITKFALAGVAVLGVGAALTSAAWTDNVFFGGSASSGSALLEGSTTSNSAGFAASRNPSAPTLTISEFVIGPDSTETTRVWVKNTGTLDLRLTTPVAVGTGPLFSNGATVVAVENDADDLLAPGQVASVDVTVTGNPAWTGTFMQGQTAVGNTILVTVEGTTDLIP